MRTSPLPADFIHHRVCKPICEKLLTLPAKEALLQKRSIQEYRSAQAALARAISRLRVKHIENI